MPKLKTKSGVKKRFKITASGKIKRWRSSHSHLQEKKRPSRKRRLRRPTLVSASEKKNIKKLMNP